MDDFWREGNRFGQRSDPFMDDMFRSSFDNRPFDSPFSILHNSMQQMHRDMDNMIRNAFGNFPTTSFGHTHPFSHQPLLGQSQQHPVITGPSDKDLDKQVQQYGLNSVFDNYTNEWDFVKQLEQMEKAPEKSMGMLQTDPNTGAKFYGRSHFHTYSATGDGKVEERKVIQDTRGNRMESMQRKLGDRVWAKTYKQNEQGEANEDEKLYNMDDDEKVRFVNEWRSMNAGLPHGQSGDLSKNLKAIDSRPSDVPVDRNNVPTQFTLPPFDDKNDGGWMDKLKFWKK